jgi:L-threonylcarbamoyladenylate synthase
MQLSNQISNIRVSGSFSSHYAPNAKVVLNVEPQQGDGFIALAQFETPLGVTRLISPNTVEEFAQELYSAFHIADQMNLQRIVVIPPDGVDLALAIRDRLSKASNGK